MCALFFIHYIGNKLKVTWYLEKRRLKTLTFPETPVKELRMSLFGVHLYINWKTTAPDFSYMYEAALQDHQANVPNVVLCDVVH